MAQRQDLAAPGTPCLRHTPRHAAWAVSKQRISLLACLLRWLAVMTEKRTPATPIELLSADAVLREELP
jgi:hypothetical protein